MFYHVQILAKKGPLGTIWIAAHHDKRLKRSQVFETNVGETIDAIVTPEVPLALRLSGQLMLGLVRIYARKVGYLLSDCSDSFGRLKQNHKQGSKEDINLSKDALQSQAHITLIDPEMDPDFFAVGEDGFGLGSIPGTPISLAGSLAGTPELLRGRASGDLSGGKGTGGSFKVKREGRSQLRRSLSFDGSFDGSPHGSDGAAGLADVDAMMFADEQFGDEMQDFAFDVEPEKLRSEPLMDSAAATPVREGGRATMTPPSAKQQAGGVGLGAGALDLEEVQPQEDPLDDEAAAADFGQLLGTPEQSPAGADGALRASEGGEQAPAGKPPRRKRQKVFQLILDVNVATGAKEISLDNKYVRSRLHNARDTLRSLKGPQWKRRRHGGGGGRLGAMASSKRGKRGTSFEGPASFNRLLLCDDLQDLFESSEPSGRGKDSPSRAMAAEEEEEQLEGLHFQSPGGQDAFENDFPAFNEFEAQTPPVGLEGGEPLPSFNDEEEEGEEGAEAEDDDAVDADEEGWSTRTKQTLSVVKEKLLGSADDAAALAEEEGPPRSCHFEDILPSARRESSGSGRGRVSGGKGKPSKREAARCFFECLVLSSKGYVNLDQSDSGAPLVLTARDKLAEQQVAAH